MQVDGHGNRADVTQAVRNGSSQNTMQMKPNLRIVFVALENLKSDISRLPAFSPRLKIMSDSAGASEEVVSFVFGDAGVCNASVTDSFEADKRRRSASFALYDGLA
jgi:hypothetical protein